MLELLEKYKEHLKNRQALWPGPAISVGRKFLLWADEHKYTQDNLKSAIQAYLNSKADYTSQTKKHQAGVIRTLLRCNNIEWPIPAGEGPRDEKDTYAPSLHPKAIETMVMTALSGRLTTEEVCLLALSTVYGLRRTEICNLRPENIIPREEAPSGWLLSVPTAKGNMPRLHIIPSEILLAVHSWGFRDKVTTTRAWQVFRAIEKKAHVEHPPEVGFHSIRRSLDTLLLERLPEAIVESFLGWSSNLSRMPKRYHKTTFVGWGETTEYSPSWRREIDEKVFSVHPFLEFWRN